MKPEAAKRTAVALALVLLTAAVFWPVGRYPFAGIDDDVVIVHNPWVNGGLSLAGVRMAFTTLAGTMWFPLTWLSYLADVQVLGPGAGSHHLVNLLIHATSAILLFFWLAALTGSRGKSAFVAAMFAIHPLHVESVVWITERKDVLSGLFWMTTLAAYLWYCRHPRPARYLVLLGSFVLGLMAKPMLVTLPFVLALLDYWPLGRFHGPPTGAARNPSKFGLIAEKVPLLAIAAGFSLLTVLAQGRGGALGSLEVVPLWARLANAIESYAWYLYKSALPSGLAIYYPHPGTAVAAGELGAAVVVLAAASWLVLRAATRWPAAFIGWLWYLGTLVPVIGLVQVGAYARADRFTYVPLIGVFIMFAWGSEALYRRRPGRPPVLALTGFAAVLAMAALGAVQVRYWQDDERLFGHALAVTERNWMVHGNLGATLMDQGRLTEAVKEFERALAYNPDYWSMRLNLGRALARLGRGGDAERQFEEALRRAPEDANVHFILGQHLADEGRLAEALPHLSAAVRIAPQFAAAQQALGWALLKSGRSAEALERFRAALALQPAAAAALNGIGAALGEQGRLEEAASAFREALRLEPENQEVRDSLSFVLDRLGGRADPAPRFPAQRPSK